MSLYLIFLGRYTRSKLKLTQTSLRSPHLVPKTPRDLRCYDYGTRHLSFLIRYHVLGKFWASINRLVYLSHVRRSQPCGSPRPSSVPRLHYHTGSACGTVSTSLRPDKEPIAAPHSPSSQTYPPVFVISKTFVYCVSTLIGS